jgi:hypothetical protein
VAAAADKGSVTSAFKRIADVRSKVRRYPLLTEKATCALDRGGRDIGK